MSYRALALILAVAMLTGCGSTSRIFSRPATVPVKETVVVKEYVPIPAELTKRGTVAKAKDRKVSEYIRVANTNTPLLEQCYLQLEEIEKLQP